MNKGVPQVFHFEPGTPQYSIDVWQDDLASTEGDADSSNASSSGSATTLTAGPSPTGTAAKTGAVTRQLPETIVFANDAQVQDARAMRFKAKGALQPVRPPAAVRRKLCFMPTALRRKRW